MRYLAAAQFKGLEGLWRKLCGGNLPDRCDKAWFFQTFCGVDAAAFAEGGYGSLDGGADIGSHLNG